MDEMQPVRIEIVLGDTMICANGDNWPEMLRSLADAAAKAARRLRKSAAEYDAIAQRIVGYTEYQAVVMAYDHQDGGHSNRSTYTELVCPHCKAEAASETTGAAGIAALEGICEGEYGTDFALTEPHSNIKPEAE